MGGCCPTLESYRPWGCVSVVFLSWSSVVSLIYDLLPTATVLMLRGCFLYPSRQPLMISSQYFTQSNYPCPQPSPHYSWYPLICSFFETQHSGRRSGGRGGGFFGDPRAGRCSLLPTASFPGICSTEGIVSQSSPSLSGSGFFFKLLHGCRNSPSFTFVHDRWV